MKKTLVLSSVTLVALGIFVGVYIVLTRKPNKQNDVVSVVTKKPVINIIRDEAIEFRNDQGQLLKTISLKPETTAVGKDSTGDKIKVSERYNVDYSKDKRFLGLRYVSNAYYKKGTRVWPPEQETAVEYYNSEGRLLWNKAGVSTFSISDDGSRVAVVLPLLSEKAKLGRYENPDMEDPKYREQLIVIDSLGNETFCYEARIFNGYRLNLYRNNNYYIWCSESIIHGDNSSMQYTYIDIKSGKKYSIAVDTLLYYKANINLDEAGNIVLKKQKGDNKPDSAEVIKIIKFGEWQ